MRKTILDLSDAREIFDQILSHWQQANQMLPEPGLRLKGGYDRIGFLNNCVEFDHLGEIIAEHEKARVEATDLLALYKTNMRGTMQRLGYLIRGLHPDSEYAKRFPALPDVRSNEDKFMDPVERVLLIWRDLNRTQPLSLPDGTTLEAFALGVQVLRQAFEAREKAIAQERYSRAVRRTHHQQLVDRAVQYRQMVLGLFGEDSVMAISLPYLWPKQNRKKSKRLEVLETESQSDASEELREKILLA